MQAPGTHAAPLRHGFLARPASTMPLHTLVQLRKAEASRSLNDSQIYPTAWYEKREISGGSIGDRYQLPSTSQALPYLNLAIRITPSRMSMRDYPRPKQLTREARSNRLSGWPWCRRGRDCSSRSIGHTAASVHHPFHQRCDLLPPADGPFAVPKS